MDPNQQKGFSSFNADYYYSSPPPPPSSSSSSPPPAHYQQQHHHHHHLSSPIPIPTINTSVTFPPLDIMNPTHYYPNVDSFTVPPPAHQVLPLLPISSGAINITNPIPSFSSSLNIHSSSLPSSLPFEQAIDLTMTNSRRDNDNDDDDEEKEKEKEESMEATGISFEYNQPTLSDIQHRRGDDDNDDSDFFLNPHNIHNPKITTTSRKDNDDDNYYFSSSSSSSSFLSLSHHHELSTPSTSRYNLDNSSSKLPRQKMKYRQRVFLPEGQEKEERKRLLNIERSQKFNKKKETELINLENLEKSEEERNVHLKQSLEELTNNRAYYKSMYDSLSPELRKQMEQIWKKK